jgi:hypothetical protein
MPRTLTGVIVGREGFYWQVETDSEERHLKTMFLTPRVIMGAPAVGSKLNLVYRSGPSYGLWFGAVVEGK